jgi:hypothetical protein
MMTGIPALVRCPGARGPNGDGCTKPCDRKSNDRRASGEQETDHDFLEPGLFVINSEGRLQVVDIANKPFAHPDLETFVSGLVWIREPENNDPVRGTYRA